MPWIGRLKLELSISTAAYYRYHTDWGFLPSSRVSSYKLHANKLSKHCFRWMLDGSRAVADDDAAARKGLQNPPQPSAHSSVASNPYGVCAAEPHT